MYFFFQIHVHAMFFFAFCNPASSEVSYTKCVSGMPLRFSDVKEFEIHPTGSDMIGLGCRLS